MANYYYVNSNVALSAGLYATKQTGAWPTNNFTSLAGAAAHSTAPTSGDFVIYAGAPTPHSFLTNSGNVSIASGVILVCTASNDCAVETTGAEEGKASSLFGIVEYFQKIFKRKSNK